MALTKEQLAARKIGGSDVATILGLNPWKSARELYHEKRGELPIPDLETNDNVEAGNIMETPIAELVARRLTRKWGTEVKLRRCNLTLVHPKYDWLTVHIDRDFVGLDRGLEIKNVGPRAWKGWGEQGTDEIPQHYLPQPHTYMLVKNYPVWTVAGYFGGGDLRFYEVVRDREMDELIISSTHDFHQAVIDGIPPEIDAASPRALDVIKRVYPGTSGEIIEGDVSLTPWIATMRDSAKLRIEYEKAEEIAKAHLQRFMGDAAIMRIPGVAGEFVRKLVKRKGYTVENSEHMEFKYKPKESDDTK